VSPRTGSCTESRSCSRALLRETVLSSSKHRPGLGSGQVQATSTHHRKGTRGPAAPTRAPKAKVHVFFETVISILFETVHAYILAYRGIGKPKRASDTQVLL